MHFAAMTRTPICAGIPPPARADEDVEAHAASNQEGALLSQVKESQAQP